MGERIKGLRIKENNSNFSALTPFGTDGNLVDMISTLDLLEEIRLGGNCETDIKDDYILDNEGSLGTRIIQKYYYIDNLRTPKEVYTYSVVTIIPDEVYDFIFVGHENSEDYFLSVNEEELNVLPSSVEYIVVGLQMNSENAIIHSYLYQGEYDEEDSSKYIFLHYKKVTVSKNKIIEDLDPQGE